MLEKERAGASGYIRDDIPRGRDLVASSAPFPGTSSNSQRSTSEDGSCSAHTDNESDTTGQSPSLSHVETSQPKTGMGYFDMASITPISPDMDMISDGHNNGYFSLSHGQKNGSDRTPDQIPGLEYDLSDSASDAQLASPDSTGIAGRRSQRPPPLSITGSKSFASGMPKTTQEMYRRPDLAGMHRVTSTGHPVRITKPMNAPRSPFHDRRGDALFYLNRSPGTTISNDSAAPSTPETPLINQSHSSEYTAQYSCTEVHPQSAELGTPPRTPSVTAPVNYESRVSGYDNPSITTAAAASYAASLALSASQVRPSLPTAIGPSFPGYPAREMEYNWSEASASNNSSPGRTHETGYMATATPAYGC